MNYYYIYIIYYINWSLKMYFSIFKYQNVFYFKTNVLRFLFSRIIFSCVEKVRYVRQEYFTTRNFFHPNTFFYLIRGRIPDFNIVV